MLNFNNVEAFLAIADMQSVSRAAEHLYLSQSTVSYRLKLLESELGCELIDRAQGQRNSVLTAKGEAFLPLARRWVALTHDMETFKKTSFFQQITVGSVDSLNQSLFFKLYNQILEKRVPIHMSLQTYGDEPLYAKMAAGSIDIAFAVENIRNKNILATPLFKERMLLLCRKGLLPEGPIHPQQLRAQDELAIVSRSLREIRLWHDRWWNPEIPPLAEINAPSLAGRFLCENDCWTVAPISTAQFLSEDPAIDVHELLDTPPKRICYKLESRYPRADHTEAIALFNRCLDEFLASIEWLQKEE